MQSFSLTSTLLLYMIQIQFMPLRLCYLFFKNCCVKIPFKIAMFLLNEVWTDASSYVGTNLEALGEEFNRHIRNTFKNF
jgi:hypothetical protein